MFCSFQAKRAAFLLLCEKNEKKMKNSEEKTCNLLLHMLRCITVFFERRV